MPHLIMVAAAVYRLGGSLNYHDQHSVSEHDPAVTRSEPTFTSRLARRNLAATRKAKRRRALMFVLVPIGVLTALGIISYMAAVNGLINVAELTPVVTAQLPPASSTAAAQLPPDSLTAAGQAPTKEASTSPAASAETPATLPLTGMVVTIDPGHQGKGDTTDEPIGPGATKTRDKVTYGAAGIESRTPESQINLDVALLLRDELEGLGARVVMVRTTQDVNIPNSERAAIANEAGSDLFIRIHCNGGPKSANGFMTIVPGANQWTGPIVDESRLAAEFMHPLLLAATGAKDLSIVSRSDLSGFNYSKVPSVLFEIGFLSNPDEDRLLNTPAYKTKVAETIAKGTAAYYQDLSER